MPPRRIIHMASLLSCSLGWTLVLTDCEGELIDNVRILCSNKINDDAMDICNSRDVTVRKSFFRVQDDIILNSSFRFTNSCYISRRGAERQSLQSLSPLLEYVFVFTNWVKELSEILLVMVFFSVEHLNFLCALRLSAPLRETFNRGF